MDNPCPSHHYGDGNKCADRHCDLFMVSRAISSASVENARPMLPRPRSMSTAARRPGVPPPPRFNLGAHITDGAPSVSDFSDTRLSERHPGHVAMRQAAQDLDDDLSHYGLSEGPGVTIDYTPATAPGEDSDTFEHDSTPTTNAHPVDYGTNAGVPPLGIHENPAYSQAGSIRASKQPRGFAAGSVRQYGDINISWMHGRSSAQSAQALPVSWSHVRESRGADRDHHYNGSTQANMGARPQDIAPQMLLAKANRHDLDFLRDCIDSKLPWQDRSRAYGILARLPAGPQDNDQNTIVSQLSRMLDTFKAVSDSSISAHTDLIATLTKHMESLEKSITPRESVDHSTRISKLEASLAGFQVKGSLAQVPADSGASTTQTGPYLRPIKNRNAIKITDAFGNPVEFGAEWKA